MLRSEIGNSVRFVCRFSACAQARQHYRPGATASVFGTPLRQTSNFVAQKTLLPHAKRSLSWEANNQATPQLRARSWTARWITTVRRRPTTMPHRTPSGLRTPASRQPIYRPLLREFRRTFSLAASGRVVVRPHPLVRSAPAAVRPLVTSLVRRSVMAASSETDLSASTVRPRGAVRCGG